MKKLFMILALVVSFNANAFIVMPHVSVSPHVSEPVMTAHEAPVMDSDHPSTTETVKSNPVYFTPHGTYIPQSSVAATPQQQIEGWHDSNNLFYAIIASIIIGAIIAFIIIP